jgi:hypothetical protein
MNGWINDHSASVMSLAYRKPCRRYFGLVISLQGTVISMTSVVTAMESQPIEITQPFFSQALRTDGALCSSLLARATALGALGSEVIRLEGQFACGQSVFKVDPKRFFSPILKGFPANP